MNQYLNKYSTPQSLLSSPVDPDTGIIVVIPVYNEPDLILALASIKACNLPTCSVEVITLINASEKADEKIKDFNRETHENVLLWKEQNERKGLKFHSILQNELPVKHAGVGLARKMGMDEAVRRFEQLQKDGIIACFDADAICDSNYLVALEKHFESFPKSPGCAIYFEHPYQGNDFEPEIYEGILNYELHLRYHKRSLEWAGLPFAFHTVGSSMAVKNSAYQKQGGMNKRKAGEDFYFLHKIIALGNFTNLNETRIIPSPRISDRVPFGTGRSIGEWVDNEQSAFTTYNFDSFKLIKKFISHIEQLQFKEPSQIDYNLSDNEYQVLMQFLEQINFEEALKKIRSNSTDNHSFVKRFYSWFDAFKILKLIHYFRDEIYPDQPIIQALNSYLEISGEKKVNDLESGLILMRELDRMN